MTSALKTPEQRAKARGFRAGLVLLGIILVALWLSFEAQTGIPFRPTTEVVAAVEDVHSLAVNDQVRQNSMRIGRVSDIEFRDDLAIVTMELEGRQDVFADATAAIWDESALATKFVEINPGSPESGPLDGEIISPERTTSSSDLYEVLEVLDEETRASAASAVQDLGGGLIGREEDLQDVLAAAPDLLDDIGEISEALSADERELIGLLDSGDRLAARFEGRESEIASLIQQTERTLAAISVDGGQPVTDTLNAAPGTLASVRTTLEGLEGPLGETEAAMVDLQPGAEALGAATPSLRGFLREAVPVGVKVPPFADEAVPAVERLTHTAEAAQPLAPRLERTFGYAREPLEVLAPYGPEAGTLFVRGHSFMSQGTAPNMRYARLNANPSVWTVTGGLIESQNYAQNLYPAPGEAEHDRVDEGLPTGIPLVGGER